MNPAIDPRFLPALKILHERLAGTALSWAITGSLGFALQGVEEVEVHDIDLQTDLQGAYLIENLLREFVTQKVYLLESPHLRSYFGTMEIAGVVVEIMGALQKPLGADAWDEAVDINFYKRWVDYAGMCLPVLDLEYEYQAYRALGRMEKVQLLESWITAHSRNVSPVKPETSNPQNDENLIIQKSKEID